MKLQPEDPSITAYVLGELTPEEAAAVEAAVEKDPAIRAAVLEAREMSKLLTGTLAPAHLSLHEDQKQAILQAAKAPESIEKQIKIPDLRHKSRPWIISLAAAAVLLLAFVIFSRRPASTTNLADHRSESTPDLPSAAPPAMPISPAPIAPAPMPATEMDQAHGMTETELVMMPAPGPRDASKDGQSLTGSAHNLSSLSRAASRRSRVTPQADAAAFGGGRLPDEKDLPALNRRSFVVAAVTPELQLPLRAGSSSIEWITQSIRGAHKLPPTNAVRLEEILNHYTIRPTGSIALAQGVSLSTEILPCPWKPSASLLIIAIKGAKDSDRDIKATFKADPATILRYRLLGYDPVSGMPSGELPTHLPAQASNLIAIEVEPTTTATNFGSIEWTVNGQPAPSIPLTKKADAEPSDDARFASLICAYSLWLADGGHTGIIDKEIVAALARELASDTLTSDRADLLDLITTSLQL